MKLAAIDIGSNSIHLAVVSAEPGQRLQILDREKDMARLAAHTLSAGRLSKETISRAVVTLRRFKQIAEANRVDLTLVTATSAVRESYNAQEFIDSVRKQVGLEVQLLPGVEEARLIALAVSEVVDFNGRRALIIDIGGGSTEFIITGGGEPELLLSVRLGSVRLTEQFIATDPASDRERQALVSSVRANLTVIVREIKRRGYDFVIGTSGTILSLVDAAAHSDDTDTDGSTGIEEPDQTMTLKQLKRLNRRLGRMTLRERAQVQGIEKRRADIIVAGGLLLETILSELDAGKITGCDWSLREGVILNYLRSVRSGEAEAALKPSAEMGPLELEIGDDVRARSVLSVARRYAYDAAHCYHVAWMATRIFDDTRGLHGLGDKERRLLQYAGLLHDIGYYISHDDHHLHSLYLIKNSEMPGFTNHEITMMAMLARYLKGPVPKKASDARQRREHEEYFALDRHRRSTLVRAAAILRIADGLDRSRRRIVSSLSCKLDGHSAIIYIGCDDNCDLEMWSADRRANWFRDIFDVKVGFEVERPKARVLDG